MSDPESRPIRFDRPERRQSEWRDFSLDQFIPVDHRVRVVWHYVQSLDLSTLEAKYKAVDGKQGRKPIDPRILLALWIYATTESVSSARAIDRKCLTDLAYMWICGGVSVNYHLIADFRSQNLDFFQQTLVATVASLLHAKIITLENSSSRWNAYPSQCRGEFPFDEKKHSKIVSRKPRLMLSE